MYEYFGRTGYFTPILHCLQGEIFSGKPFITSSRILGKSLTCSHKNPYT